mmetsp:Transcript_27800/g.52124  ORF Transcript_27800/g.52124 Transcript_27800/m.52124 type:complete len:139 (+) Transcript_27800:282-698(+)
MLPKATKHIVVSRCFTFSYQNIVEVYCLTDGGKAMVGLNPGHFTVQAVSQWLSIGCSHSGKKKQVLSCLQPSNNGQLQNPSGLMSRQMMSQDTGGMSQELTQMSQEMSQMSQTAAMSLLGLSQMSQTEHDAMNEMKEL